MHVDFHASLCNVPDLNWVKFSYRFLVKVPNLNGIHCCIDQPVMVTIGKS